ncbi:MAG: histidine phosphatase family protein, partial [Pseudomonadota bacterium]
GVAPLAIDRAAAFAFQGAANGSISRIVIEGTRMSVRGFNDTAHLAGI